MFIVLLSMRQQESYYKKKGLNMKRYHVKVFVDDKHKNNLISFTYKLNNIKWAYTAHCLDIIKLRALDMQQLLYWIKTQLRLDYNDIFEFYTNDMGNIVKACYRIAYNKGVDIILVLGKFKQIITIYYNAKNDLHFTLNEKLYVKC